MARHGRLLDGVHEMLALAYGLEQLHPDATHVNGGWALASKLEPES